MISVTLPANATEEDLVSAVCLLRSENPKLNLQSIPDISAGVMKDRRASQLIIAKPFITHEEHMTCPCRYTESPRFLSSRKERSLLTHSRISHANPSRVLYIGLGSWKEKQLGETQTEIQKRIQERLKEMEELNQAVESLKVEVLITQPALKYPVLGMTAEVIELIGANEKAAVNQAEERKKKLEQEISELRRRDTELKQLSETEDHIHFLQRSACIEIKESEKIFTELIRSIKKIHTEVIELIGANEKAAVNQAEGRMKKLQMDWNTSTERSACIEIKESEKIFTELIRSIEKIHTEVIELIGANVKAAVNQAEGRMKKLDQEIAELRRRNDELKQLSETEDHIHFLQGGGRREEATGSREEGAGSMDEGGQSRDHGKEAWSE
ncbi:UNVERIFIED_CONTAM: hypothetical protein FKN15_017429 [Acipenser sinensis]